MIILIGTEPHLRWGTFSDCVTTVATEMHVQAAFTIGAMLADVAHTRPTPVRGSSADPKMAERLGLARPRYQGPTGIVGRAPGRLRQGRHPRRLAHGPGAALHLSQPVAQGDARHRERVCELLMTEVPTADLQNEVGTHERQISEAVAADDAIAAYVRELERRADLAPEPAGSAISRPATRWRRSSSSSCATRTSSLPPAEQNASPA